MLITDPRILVLVAFLITTPAAAQLETFDGAGSSFPHQGWTTTGLFPWFPCTSCSPSPLNSGPTRDVCGTGKYAYFESNTGLFTSGSGELISPIYDADGLLNPIVRFNLHMHVETPGTLLRLSAWTGSAWQAIWLCTEDRGPLWTAEIVKVPRFWNGSGFSAQLRFEAAYLTAGGSSMAIDNVRFGSPLGMPQNQANSVLASLTFSGAGSGVNCGIVGPYTHTTGANQAIAATVSVYELGPRPFALLMTPGVEAVAGPGIATDAGFIDFRPDALPFVQTVIDGFNPTTFLDLLFGQTDGAGLRTIPLTSGPTPGTLATMQAVIADPTKPSMRRMTGATEFLVVGPPAPDFVGDTAVFVGDDTTTFLSFNPGFDFPFYGAVYTGVWVNSNGSLSFGGNGDDDPSASVADLEAEEPRIAGFWTDLDPAPGTVGFSEAPTSFVVSWTGVYDPVDDLTDNFGIRIHASGTIEIAFGVAGSTAPNSLVGISPGTGSPVGPAVSPGPLDLSAMLPQSFVGTAPMGVYEFFAVQPFDLGASFASPEGGALLSFVPNPTQGAVGDQGYTAP